MYNFLSKNGQLVAFIIGLIITAIFLFSVFSGLSGFNALAEDQRGTTDIFNFGLYAAAGLTALCAAVALLFGLFQTLSNPKGAIAAIAAVIGLAVLFFAGQSLAGTDSAGVVRTMGEFSVTEDQGTFINGAIGGGLLLIGLAMAAFVLSEVRNLFK